MIPRRLVPIAVLCCLAFAGAGCRHQQPQPSPAATPEPVTRVAIRDADQRARLRRGFHDPGDEWCWTARVFAVSLDLPRTDRALFLVLDFSLAEELMSQYRDVTLMARVNGIEIGRKTYNREGRYEFVSQVPRPALAKQPAEVEFELDKSAKDPINGRDLGLIFVSAAFLEYEETPQYRAEQMETAREGYRKLIDGRRRHLSRAAEIEMVKLFHSLPVWDSLWYQNVRIIKNPLDLWMMQQILYEVRPEFVIETGTWNGGSALYFASVFTSFGMPGGRVLTVDLGNFTQGASVNPLWKQHVTFYQGSSVDPAIVAKIAGQVRNAKTLVTLDSDHSARHVLNELKSYAPMVSPGSYLIVEDTHIDAVPTHPEQGPGPMAAVEQFLKTDLGKQFERDDSREAMVMTFNPGGWLRRKDPAAKQQP
ncbi:MAG: CmcI family methyltransferase [Bryobacterales bacterium]|nr:CmcI family methyltransferase [Bryobacterales bacterium]